MQLGPDHAKDPSFLQGLFLRLLYLYGRQVGVQVGGWCLQGAGIEILKWGNTLGVLNDNHGALIPLLHGPLQGLEA